MTSQGVVTHGLSVDERHDGRGNPYFWLKHHRVAEEHAAGTDVHAIRRGVISITPLRIDMTAYDQAHELNALFA